jgi:hypothetical protein
MADGLVRYGMFSKEQRRLCGSAIYSSVDKPGTEVEVTQVFDTVEQFEKSNYTDKKNVGRIQYYIRDKAKDKLSKLTQ